MLDLLITNSVSAFFTIVVGYLSYQVNKMNIAREKEQTERQSRAEREKADIDAVKIAVMYVIQNDLRRSIEYHMELQSISIDTKEELFKEYKCYKDLGGNGTMDYWMNELEKVPVEWGRHNG